MCGRYTIALTWQQLWTLSQPFWQPLPEIVPRYNVAPKSEVPILRMIEAGDGDGDESDIRPGGSFARWWLIPRWARTPDSSYSMFNARSEDAHTKPAFKASMHDRRCVIPASGFYEWKAFDSEGAAPAKRPHYIYRADGAPLYFAGLWERWGDEALGQIETCTVLTTTPNAEMRLLHDRMPCVLEPEEIERWIDPGCRVDEARPLLRPAADGVLTSHPVAKRVGSVRNDGPDLIEPVDVFRESLF
ncbi:MAG: SOS response-associated peptidase [Planctomycetota bacterium]